MEKILVLRVAPQIFQSGRGLGTMGVSVQRECVCLGMCRYECAVYIGGSKGVMGKLSLSLSQFDFFHFLRSFQQKTK